MSTSEVKQKILRIIQKHARTSDQEIADRLQLDPVQVGTLIAEMETDKTIIGYYTIINNEQAEATGVRAIIEVEVQPERNGGFDPIARRLSKFQEVRTVYLLSGSYDLGLEVEGESLQEVAHFVASKLAPIDGVKSTRTHFLLKKYKESGILLHEDEEHERLKIVP